MRRVLAVICAVWAGMGQAVEVPEGMGGANVIFLGEVHDNPNVHKRQSELVAALKPKALVFEMLTPKLAEKATPEMRGDADTLATALHWEHLGWPDFNMYYPIFAAAPQAAIYGAAVPREEARAAMKGGVSESFGTDAEAFGLTVPLSEDEQAAREAFQHEAHCDALPGEMLPMMVELQRLRDAVLARAAVQALDEVGGPVVVITGNGHARKDWGAPVYLQRVSGAVMFSLAIAEHEEEGGPFDAVEIVPEAEREDPCAVFNKE
ncbi:ChaN family lipoprotein [Alisedimentitalea sp. MJ-SS2]|uniref:ChaN family lipoprotein n=1 Tax=Aliisedimentitalea sp. MJ-SS2 TaxID=3049795 RepID=UPI002910FD0A|nr:ChaN family lipoprotein [Alisedimentitalea sp. MJ-SS2]MDU8928818.1 ChaN family lipoprotein [Alisedimentitalea sp. MJ-SS2]